MENRKEEIKEELKEIAHDDEAYEAIMYETLAEDDIETFLCVIRELIYEYTAIHGYMLSDVVEALCFHRDPADVRQETTRPMAN